MHRIDTSTAQKDKFGAGKNGFTEGNPQTGTPATALNSAFFDTIQEEIAGVVEATGTALNTDNNAQLLAAIRSLISETSVPAIDDLYITKGKTDPNVKWPGTTWEYLGEGLTLRTAKADLSDIGTTIGADTVTIATGNLPSHTHTIGGSTGSSTATTLTTSSFDYGTKSSNSTGAHTHTVSSYDPGGSNTSIAAAEADGNPTTNTTSSSGAHTHTTVIGAHTHTGTIPAHSHTLPAATGAVGSGTAISILQKSIMVAVWVRTA
ncbi:hypothetical protein ACX3SV_01180 [Hafnia paralvei]